MIISWELQAQSRANTDQGLSLKSVGVGVGRLRAQEPAHWLPRLCLFCHFLSGDGFLKSCPLPRSVPALSVLDSHFLRFFSETGQWSASFNVVLIYEVRQCYSRFI